MLRNAFNQVYTKFKLHFYTCSCGERMGEGDPYR